MSRAMGLLSGAGLLGMVIGRAAAAQSIITPADQAETPAATVAEPGAGGEIVVTGSRIRRDPLSQDQPIVFVDQADIAKSGLNSSMMCCSACQARVAAKRPVQQLR